MTEEHGPGPGGQRTSRPGTAHGHAAEPTPGAEHEVDRVAGWARRLGTGARLHLRCSDALAPQQVPAQEAVRWPGCLNSLPVADLATLAAAAPHLVLGLGSCRREDGGPVDGLRRLLAQVGLEHRVHIDGQQEGAARPAAATAAPELPITRRDLFAWARPARPEPAPGPQRLAPSSSAEHGEAQDQVRLAAALRELSRQEDDTARGQDGAAPVGETGAAVDAGARTRAHRLSVAGCTACGTCVRACPTAALDLSPAPGEHRVSLQLLPDACIGCLQCVALCPVEAVSDGGAMAWPDLLRTPTPQELETVEVRPCTRCRTPFAGEGELCQVCRMRAGNPFGSWLPPGYVAPRVYAPAVPDEVDEVDERASPAGLEEQVRRHDVRDR